MAIAAASCWFNALASTGTSRYTISSQRLFSSSQISATRLIIPKATSQGQNPKKRTPKEHTRKSSPEKEANSQKFSRGPRDERQYSNADDHRGTTNAEQPQSTAFKSFGMQRKGAKGFMGNLKDQQVQTAKIQDASFLNAVVKVYCTHTAPDYSLPWQKQRQFTSTGSAFMIGDGKLLTNAHCVEHNTQVKVKRRGDDTKYVAKVLAKGMECDIALLSVENEKFWKGAEPLQFGHLPRLQVNFPPHFCRETTITA